MNGPSSLVLALGVLNLLLVGAGLLMVYFDWSAARRREFLYLYFTEERPGANYFYSAKRRRAQFSRLLAAFSVLLLQQILAAWALASVADASTWDEWQNWWQNGQWHPAIASAVSLSPWIYYLEVLGLGLLAFGFLYPHTNEEAARHDVFAAAFVAIWAVFVLIAVSGVLRENTSSWVQTASLAAQTGVVTWVVWQMLHRRREEETARDGLMPIEPTALAGSFLLWLLGHGLGYFVANPIGAPLGTSAALVPLVLMIARGVLAEYETVESSRHRMGRERAVIFSFLQRIGAAFTTAVDLDKVLNIVLDSGLKTTEASAGAIYLYHRENGHLEPRLVNSFFPPLYVDSPAATSAHRTEDLESEMKHQSFALGEGIIGQVAQSGQAQLIRDVAAEGIMLGTTTEWMRNRSMLVVPLRIRDEPLGVMAVLNRQRGSFGRDDQQLLQALADQGALSINYAMLTHEVRQQERLRRELQIARDIQQHLLPDKCPEIPGFTIAGRATSATEVGGDYYDFVTIDADHLGIVLADVSGKGVHAALVVAMIRSAFRTQARNTLDVGEVLAGVNEFISQDLPQNMFVTCVYGVLEISTRTFSWGRAGHESLLIAHSDGPSELMSPPGCALGVADSVFFREVLEVQHIQLRSGDRLLLFTDGLTEAMNLEGEEFGMERIVRIMDDHGLNGSNGVNGHAAHNGTHASETAVKVLSDEKRNAGPEQFGHCAETADDPCAPSLSVEEPDDIKALERAVAAFVGEAPQSDDLTIVYLAAD